MTPPTSPHFKEHLLRRLLRPLRNALAAAFGLTPEAREQCVRQMLERHRRDALGHWFQLLVSMGIATFGLVLNSAAVVIGAMLISPLMTPLVELGMGLAIGSAVLALRALSRTLLSVAGVVLAAAVLIRALPFNQLTPEISARTSPTVLDLFVAALCALMAAYTTIRAGSDTTATAAGTAIGIALVPPLCVVGWGLGTSHYALSGGAALLFTANFCAILVLTVAMFVLLGFDDLDIVALEQSSARREQATDRAAERLRNAFGSSYGLLFRWGLPLVLFAGVFVPLRRALGQLESEVHVRAAVEKAIRDATRGREFVQSNVDVKGTYVDVRLVVVADSPSATRIRNELEAQIRPVTGVPPKVSVVAVPDLHAIQRLTAEPPQRATTRSVLELGETFARVRAAVSSVWPEAAAGRLLSWSLSPGDESVPVLSVEHLGAPLGSAGELLLAQSVSATTGAQIRIRDVALPPVAVTARAEDGRAWLIGVLPLIDAQQRTPSLFLCVSAPPADAAPDVELGRAQLLSAFEAVPRERRAIRDAESWSAQLSLSPCPEPPATETADGGAPATPLETAPSGQPDAVAP